MNANIRRASKVAEATQPWMDDRQEVTASVNEQRITITEERPTDLNIEGAARGAATYRGDRIANEKLAKFSGGGALFAATLGGGKDLIAGDPAPDDWMNSCAAVLRGSGHAAMALMDYRSGASFIRGGAGKVHVGYSDVDGFGAADVLLGDALVAAQNGRVGVGVGAPAAPLHVSGEYPQLLLQHETTEQEASVGVTDEGGLEVISPNGHTRVFGRAQVDTLAAGAVIATRTHTSSLLLDKIMSLNGSILIGASAAYLSYDCAVPAMIQRSNPFTPATQTVFVVGVDERVNEAGVQVFDVGATIRFYWMTRTTATTSSLVYVEASIVSYIGRDASDATRPVAVQTYEVRVTSYPPYSDSYSSPNLYPAFTLPEGVMVIQATSDAEITSRIAGKPLIRVGTTYIGWDGNDLIGGIKGTYARSEFQFGVRNQDGYDDYIRFKNYSTGASFFEAISHYGLGAQTTFRLGSTLYPMLSYSGAGAADAPAQSLAILGATVTTKASTTGAAGLNVPHGVPPTSPVDGDIWTTAGGTPPGAPAGLFARINGVTIQAASVAATQPLDATLTALAGVATAADKLIYATGSDAFATTDFSAFGRTLVDDASAAAARTTIGLALLSESGGVMTLGGQLYLAPTADAWLSRTDSLGSTLYTLGLNSNQSSTNTAAQTNRFNYLVQQVNPANNPGGTQTNAGFYSELFVPSSNSQALSNVQLRALVGFGMHAGTGTVNTVIGVNANSRNNSTGTITTGAAFNANLVNNVSGGVMTSGIQFRAAGPTNAGTITTYSGFRVENFANTGTVGTAYGFYAGTFTGGTWTNAPYSFYAASTSAYNSFAGPTVIGDSAALPAPGAALRVNGAASAITAIFRANVTTPGNLTEWQDSSSNVLLSVGSGGDVTFGDAKNIIFNTTNGTKIGTSTSQKLAFYNATPIAQRSGAAQAAVATTGATNSSPYGFTTAAQADAIVTLLNEVRAALVALGLIKGSA